MNTETFASMMNGATLTGSVSLGVQRAGKPVTPSADTVRNAENLAEATVAIAAANVGLTGVDVEKGLAASRVALQSEGPPAAVIEAATPLHETGTVAASPASSKAPTSAKGAGSRDGSQKQR